MTRVIRFFFSALATLVLLVSALLTVDRFLGPDPALLVRAASFASYAVVGYVVAIVLLLLLVRGAKHRQVVLFGAVLALLGIGLHAYWLAPLYYGNAAGDKTDLTVMTSNLHLGDADPSTVVRAAADNHVDVLVLEEVNDDELTQLDRAGLGDLYSERAGSARDGARGTIVLSDYALSDEREIPVANGGVAVRVGAPRPFELLAVHTYAPARGVARWIEDLRTVRDVAAAAARKGPTVVAGDFNATTDHAQFRKILAAGLSDVTAQANSGWQPTWPTKYASAYVRPLIAIDHVLTTPDYSAVSTSTVSVPGTDHLALIARLDRV